MRQTLGQALIGSAALILSANTYTPRATYLISVQDPINFPTFWRRGAQTPFLWDLVKNESANLSNAIFSDKRSARHFFI